MTLVTSDQQPASVQANRQLLTATSLQEITRVCQIIWTMAVTECPAVAYYIVCRMS